MFEEAGYAMSIYDPFYAPYNDVVKARYDFITCTEVVEHLREPGQVLTHLVGLLNPRGWLGIMTKLVIDKEAFADWHYKNDLTHIGFFSRDTFQWLGKRLHCRVAFIGQDVILLQKNEGVDKV
jgi:hypothetical protein